MSEQKNLSQTLTKIHGLAAMIAAADDKPLPPVNKWDPPYCGDIGLKIDGDGTWHYRDSPIRRDRLTRLFSRVLRCDDDGRHYVVTPVEKIDVHVEDAPFVAVEMEVSGEGEHQLLTFRTNVDDIVQCSKGSPLCFTLQPPHGGLKPYLVVRDRLRARVSRSVFYDLVELAVPAPGKSEGELCVWSNGTCFPLSTI